MRASGDMEALRHEMQLFKDSIVKSMYAFMVDTKGGEKQMHGAFPQTKLPTGLAIEVAELEKLKDAWEDSPGQQAIQQRRIDKLRRQASLFSRYPKALIDIATSTEEQLTQEVIPPVAADFDELIAKTSIGQQ